MGCVVVDLPGGGTAIVCARGKRSFQPCVGCKRLGTRLCDFKVGAGTCSASICARCTTRLPGDKDACPAHREVCLEACRRHGLAVPA